MKEIKVYQTSDGKTFEEKFDAELHQTHLDNQNSLLHKEQELKKVIGKKYELIEIAEGLSLLKYKTLLTEEENSSHSERVFTEFIAFENLKLGVYLVYYYAYWDYEDQIEDIVYMPIENVLKHLQ